MNERTMRDRWHALGPLVLRLGIAAVLTWNGLHRLPAGLGETEAAALTEDSQGLGGLVTAFSADGLSLNANWGSLLGVAELAAGGLLVLGLLTRPLVLAMLGLLGYALVAGFSHASLPDNAPAMWLLAAVCLSLLASGPGCLALRRRRRIVLVEPPPAPPRHDYRDDSSFVVDGPTLHQRVKALFKRKRRRPRQRPAMKAATRRWRWWQLRTG